MYQLDNEKFGGFVAQLRKDKKLTQKELAERLFVSDKTVSKWERGLSMPNVSLLIPIADILGVTVTELLKGEKINEAFPLDIKEVENLVTCSMDMTIREQAVQQKYRRKWVFVYILGLSAVLLELFLLISYGNMADKMKDNILLLSGMMLLFGGWFCIFAKETLPTYYDENQINVITDGFFKMQIVGLHFNNKNWPYIIKAGRIETLLFAILFPICYYGIDYIFNFETKIYNTDWFMVLLFASAFFVPIYVVGKKYE